MLLNAFLFDSITKQHKFFSVFHYKIFSFFSMNKTFSIIKEKKEKKRRKREIKEDIQIETTVVASADGSS